MTEQKTGTVKKPEPIYFEKEELQLMRFALISRWDEKNNQAVGRVLELDEQEDGISINRKLKALTVVEMKDGKEDRRFPKPAEVAFSTSEKALLLKIMARPWVPDDAEFYVTTKEKLS